MKTDRLNVSIVIKLLRSFLLCKSMPESMTNKNHTNVISTDATRHLVRFQIWYVTREYIQVISLSNATIAQNRLQVGATWNSTCRSIRTTKPEAILNASLTGVRKITYIKVVSRNIIWYAIRNYTINY